MELPFHFRYNLLDGRRLKSSFERLYEEVLTLSELVGSTEQRPCICSRYRNRDNTPTDSVVQCWQRPVAIPLLDIIF